MKICPGAGTDEQYPGCVKLAASGRQNIFAESSAHPTSLQQIGQHPAKVLVEKRANTTQGIFFKKKWGHQHLSVKTLKREICLLT